MKICSRTILVDSVPTALRDLGPKRSYNDTEVDFKSRIITVEDSVEVAPEGYVFIDDIEGWDQWGLHAHDMIYVDAEIRKLYDVKTWDNCNDNEKKAVCTRFLAAGDRLTEYYSDRADEDKSRDSYEREAFFCRKSRYRLALSEIKYRFSSDDVKTTTCSKTI